MLAFIPGPVEWVLIGVAAFLVWMYQNSSGPKIGDGE